METLRHGLNFAIAPKRILTADIVASVETGIYNLAPTSQRCNPSLDQKTRNILPDQHNASQDYCYNNLLVIIPVDKARTVVAMHREKYQSKVRNISDIG